MGIQVKETNVPTLTTASESDSPFKREDVRAQKLEFIRSAASNLFNRRGFDATSLEDVADAVGISKPSVYYYYRNKSELLFGCYSHTLDVCDRLLQEAADAGGTALDQICYFARGLLYLNCANGAIAVVSEISSLPGSEIEAFRERTRQLTRKLKALARNGVEDGSCRSDMGDIMTMFIMGGINWTPRWYQDSGPLTASEIADAYIEFLIGGIAAR